MATKIPIIKYREFFHISMRYISAINEHIYLFEIYTSHASLIMKGTNGDFSIIKLPSNVKVKIKHINNHEKHIIVTLSQEVVETSCWSKTIP